MFDAADSDEVKDTSKTLMSSAGDFHARTSATPVAEKASMAPGPDCGAKWSDSFATYDRATSSWKTSQPCLLVEWIESSVIWPTAGWMRNGTCWGADDFGASQHRKRIWLLAYTNNPRLQGPIWAGQSRAPRQTWPAAHSEPLRSTGGLWPPGPGALADVPRMADGPADRAHRLRSLGNAVVPQIAQWIAERINEAEEQVGSAGLGVA
jgi:hypothetical protein